MLTKSQLDVVQIPTRRCPEIPAPDPYHAWPQRFLDAARHCRMAVVSADAAYDASQVGLEVGTRTVLDVLINQQNLFNARQAYAIAKYNYLQNRLLLDQSAGSLDRKSTRLNSS